MNIPQPFNPPDPNPVDQGNPADSNPGCLVNPSDSKLVNPLCQEEAKPVNPNSNIKLETVSEDFVRFYRITSTPLEDGARLVLKIVFGGGSQWAKLGKFVKSKMFGLFFLFSVLTIFGF